MTGRSVAVLLAIVGGLVAASPVRAAFGVAVSVSPSAGVVGAPLEVQVRTFVPVGTTGVDLATPSHAYPAPSGAWNVLYPMPDYPFDVVARSPAGDVIPVRTARDPADGSLWRGAFTPAAAGEWTIEVRNFPTATPSRVTVADASAPSPAVVGGVAFVAGVLGGLGAAGPLRGWLRRRS